MTRKDITYQEKLNELILDLSHPKSRGICFILFEAETDVRLFRKLFNLENCKVEAIPGGNPKVEAAVSELLKICELVIGIRDADFLNLETIPYSQPNMFLTDCHDIEMTIFAENTVVNAILVEYTDIPKQEHDSVIEKIFLTIKHISLLKWLNDVENLELTFRGVGFQDLLASNFNINFETYFARLLSKSPDARISEINIIKAKIIDLDAKNPNSFQLCNGHDFVKTFSEFIRQHGKEKGITEDNISSMLRACYSIEHFYETNLFASTKAWAVNKNCDIHL